MVTMATISNYISNLKLKLIFPSQLEKKNFYFIFQIHVIVTKITIQFSYLITDAF